MMLVWKRLLVAVSLWLAVIGLLSGCGSQVKKEKVEGYKGDARLNPFLVAERFLEEVSFQEVSVRNDFVSYDFVSYDFDMGMCVAPASNLYSEATTDKILDWVSYGGVYVCLLQRGEKTYKDVGEECDHNSKEWLEVESPTLQYLLDQLEINLVDEPTESTTGGQSYYEKTEDPVVLGEELPIAVEVDVVMNPNTYKMKIGGTKTMKLNRPLSDNDYYDKPGSDGSHRFLGIPYGNGRIYFISDARPFRNPYLGMYDHARVLETIANESYGDIVFTFNKRRGFWALMIHYALPALLGILVLLTVWLWKNIPRFGPLLEIPEAHTRDYLESIKNTGHFLWKHKRCDALLAPLRSELCKRSGLFNEQGEARASIMEKLSESSGVPEDQILEALSREVNIDDQSMVRIIKNLQTILKSL